MQRKGEEEEMPLAFLPSFPQNETSGGFGTHTRQTDEKPCKARVGSDPGNPIPSTWSEAEVN